MQLNTYSDINDLPILSWFEIHNNSAYELLFKKPRALNEKVISKLLEVWDVLNNQFLERFGLNEDAEYEMELRNKIAEFQAIYIIEDKKYYRTFIAIEQEKLRVHNMEVIAESNLEQIVTRMSIILKFKLEAKSLTTGQYYNYLNELSNG